MGSISFRSRILVCGMYALVCVKTSFCLRCLLRFSLLRQWRAISIVPSVCVCVCVRFRANLHLCIHIHTYHMLQTFSLKFISIPLFFSQREPSGFSSTSSAQVGSKCSEGPETRTRELENCGDEDGNKEPKRQKVTYDDPPEIK